MEARLGGGGAGVVDATINNVLQSNYRVVGPRVGGANACKLTFCGARTWEEPVLESRDDVDVNISANRPFKNFPCS